MPRTRRPARQHRIVTAAINLFMRRGYAATRMEMIAADAGVAPGTLYLYADGKDALFDLALRTAFDAPVADAVSGPHRMPDRESVIESTWRLVRECARFPVLERAAGLPEVADAGAELEEVILEFWDWLSRYWRGIRMVEKCALDWPELSTFFYAELRRGGLKQLEGYLEGRAGEGRLRAMPDAGIAARAILESVSFFAMHRHTAPDSSDLEEAAARDTVVALLRGGLVP